MVAAGATARQHLRFETSSVAFVVVRVLRVRIRKAARPGRGVEAAGWILRPVDRLKCVKVALVEVEEVREGVRAVSTCRRRVHGKVVRVGPELVAANPVRASETLSRRRQCVLDEVENAAKIVAVIRVGTTRAGRRAGDVAGESDKQSQAAESRQLWFAAPPQCRRTQELAVDGEKES